MLSLSRVMGSVVSLGVRFGNGGQASAPVPTMYEMFTQDTVSLQRTEPTRGQRINALRLEFFKAFKDLAPAVLMVTQFRKALDRFPIYIPWIMRGIPESYVIKEFAKVGFDVDQLKAAVKQFDKGKGEEKYGELITYCDDLAKKNFKAFLNTNPAGNGVGANGEVATPTLLQLLNGKTGELAATDRAKAAALVALKDELYGALGEYGSIVLVFTQYRKAMNNFPLPVPGFVMNFVVREFAGCGFDEGGLQEAIAKFDGMRGDERFKELAQFCTQLAKANFRDFLRVPAQIQ